MRVVVIDLGVSNIRSVSSALDFLGARHEVTADSRALASATHVILPGVGAFDAAVRRIEALNLREAITTFARMRERPLLGICLGMQLLHFGSDEGELPGLGIMPGRLSKLLHDEVSLNKVPHVGFSNVFGYPETGLFQGLGVRSNFYFTHSYALPGVEAACNAAWCEHSSPFVAAYQMHNICGTQFHPEKSQSTGLRLLTNFLELR